MILTAKALGGSREWHCGTARKATPVMPASHMGTSSYVAAPLSTQLPGDAHEKAADGPSAWARVRAG